MKQIIVVFLLCFISFSHLFSQTGRIEIENEKYGIVENKTKKLIADYIYDDIETFHGTGYLVMQNDKIGLLNKAGHKIFDCIYEEIHTLPDNSNFVVLEDASANLSVYSVADKKFVFSKFSADMSNPICGPYNEFTGAITKTIIIIQKNGKSGVLELPNRMILPAEYQQIISCEYKRGVIILKKEGKFRFYNLKEKKLLSPEFEINGNDENLQIKKNGTSSIDASDYFPAKIKGKWGIMNLNGKFKIQPKFDKLRSSPHVSKNAFTVVYTQDNWFTYNYGKMKPFNIDHFIGFWYNYAVIIKNEKVLFYNTKGVKSLEIKLKNQNDNKNKVFNKNGKYGVVSHKSKLVVDFEFQYAHVIKNVICVRKNNKFALFNDQGKNLTAFVYEDILVGSIIDRILIIKQYGKYGLMDFEGKELIKPKYTFISSFYEGKATAKLYKTELEIDTKGNQID